MNQREKEKYLREYQVLKEQGKQFFPYAVLKDSVMALIMAVIMIMLALLLGAELGPQADPTTTTYVPRPDWYYFFLFELLRIIRDPNWLIMATIGIPTIALALLVLLPFYDRGPERNPVKRPVAMTAMTMTVLAMGYLTILGATSGSPIDFGFDVPKKYEKGKLAVEQAGCLACHRFGENGNSVGPDFDKVSAKFDSAAILRTMENPIPPMPSFDKITLEKRREIAEFVANLDTMKKDEK